MFCTGGGASRVSTLCGEDGGEAVTISGTAIRDSSSTSALPAGSYSFQASWPGDSNYNSATGDCEPLTVNKASTTTATAIHPAPGDTVGTSVADAASVPDHTTGIPTSTPFPITGTVQFRFSTAGCGGTFSNFGGPVSLASGTAESASTAPLAAGSYAFKAVYSGDSNYFGSTGDCEPLTVNKASTTTATEIHDATHTLATVAGLGT